MTSTWTFQVTLKDSANHQMFYNIPISNGYDSEATSLIPTPSSPVPTDPSVLAWTPTGSVGSAFITAVKAALEGIDWTSAVPLAARSNYGVNSGDLSVVSVVVTEDFSEDVNNDITPS